MARDSSHTSLVQVMYRRLQACLDIDPEKRLTCTELLKLPYLTGVEATIPPAVLKAQVATSHTNHTPYMTLQSHSWGYTPVDLSTGNGLAAQKSENGVVCAGEGGRGEGYAGQAAQAEAQVCRP